MRRSVFILTLCALLAAAVLAGCGEAGDTDKGRISVVSTIFPGYDFARQICGENASITLLLPPGSESHSYEPTAKDIIRIQNCDLFIYVGGESDTWVDGILESLEKPVRTLRMMECVETVEEELKEGMEAHEEEHGEAHDGEHGEEVEYDEHVWTSPANAIAIMKALTEEISAADPEYADTYASSAALYIEKLEALDADFREFFAGAKSKTLVFGDRFPLRYFTDEYGLDYFAAFPGCASETEPSAATIAFLIDKVKAEKISTVFYIEFSNHRVADSIAEATGAKTALFNTCHNVTKEQLAAGATYYSLMEENLAVLRSALS